MSCIKTVYLISIQNFRKWKTDYRVWVLGILVLILTHGQISDLNRIADVLNVPQSAWTYPFLYAQFFMKLIFTLPLLFLFCDAPFLDANQGFIFARAGRAKWCLGQLLYIAQASAVYYLFIIALTILLPFFRIEWSTDWGSFLHTLARTTVLSDFGLTSFNFSPNVLAYFTPLQAMWFTFLVSWFSGIFLGLLIYAFNLLFKSKTLGGIIGAILILLSAFLTNDNPTGTGASWFSPFSWNTLNQIDIAGMTNSPPFWYCMTFYLVGIIVLSAMILIVNRKMEIVQNGAES